jgi:ADP-heptose:LPS heptosyltransferase
MWFEKGAYASSKAVKLANKLQPLEVKNIAIVRMSAFGDLVISRAFIIEVKRFFPNAKITFVGVTNYSYAIPNDLVDSVHLIYGNSCPKQSLLDRYNNLVINKNFDFIFDICNTSRSRLFTFLNKANFKVGFPYKNIFRAWLYNVCVFRSDFTPEIESMLDMLKIFGHVPARPLDFGYAKLPVKNRIVYFNGASQDRKRLSDKAFHDLLSLSISQYPDYQHVFLEGLGSNEKGNSFEDLLVHRCFSIQPALPLNELSSLLSSSSVVVSVDTGVRNLAIATHTPTVGIFMCTVPFRYTPTEVNHQIVMKPSGDIPSVDLVISAISKTMI